MDPLTESLLAADDLAHEVTERLSDLAQALQDAGGRMRARGLPMGEQFNDLHSAVTRARAELARVAKAVAVYAAPVRAECEEFAS